MKNVLLAIAATVASTAFATPVEVDWKAGETAPAKVARPFAGFLPDGRFVVAGGSDFVDGKKVYRSGICARELDGKWSKVGELPRVVAEGVSCETPKGIFCAGGTDGTKVFDDAFLLVVENGAVRVTPLPLSLPEPVAMGAAAADGSTVYVVASNHVFVADLGKTGADFAWRVFPMPCLTPRAQMVATIQNGDQKEKMLVVYGGYDAETKQPLHDGYGLVLSQLSQTSQLSQSAPWRKLAPLPENTTTIGAAFLPSGHQHILLVGGFGEKGWVDRALRGSTETDPVKLGWQRKILAYNCVTDAWCEYGEIAAADSPRCGAARYSQCTNSRII